MMESRPIWSFNPDTGCEVFGQESRGGAVWQEESGIWTGNAVLCDKIHNVGNYSSYNEAKIAVEVEFAKMVQCQED